MATAPDVSPRALRALDALNFFLADVRDGLGPYLAIYLLAVRGPEQGWNEATTGVVMTLAGLAGLAAQMPAGALLDRWVRKRAVVIAAALVVTAGCLLLPWVNGFYAVAATQAAAQIAAAFLPPALVAITLGVVGPKALARRIGRNEGFNHAGNATSAALAAGLAWYWGPQVVFWLMALLALLSIVAASGLPAASPVPHTASEAAPAQNPLRWLKQQPTLVLFACLAALFHLANAAMLTSVSQLLARQVGQASATSLTAICIVAAQCVMVPVALLVGRYAERIGHKPIFLLGFAVLALRGLLYPLSDSPGYLLAVQCLDGIGAGIYGALFPLVVAALCPGRRFNFAQGVVGTAQGLGAAVSASLAGGVIVAAGYGPAFWMLGGIAGAGALLYLWRMPETANRSRPTPPVASSAAPPPGPSPRPGH